jgi:hypothetical protein
MPPSTSQLTTARDKSSVAARVGFVLIMLSGVLWFSLFAIPWLPLTVAVKAVLAGGVFLGVQVAWWSGAALVGPRTIARLKAWFGKKKPSESP